MAKRTQKQFPNAEYDDQNRLKPAVPTKKSLTPDYIISLIDGKKLKQLTNHLASYGLTAEQYREVFGLPADYPMTAPAHTAEAKRARRSYR
jgi:predicted transcriptional regulator